MRKPLTSLRAIVVFFVFVTHLRFLYQGADFLDFHETYMGNGDICVTFFFVLSGMVFSLGYGERFTKLSIREWGSFVWKRLKRVYPLYLVTVIVMLSWQAIEFPNHALYLRGEAFHLALATTLTQTFNPTLGTSMIFNCAGWYLSAAFAIYLVTPILLRLNHLVRHRPWATRILLVLALAGHLAYEAALVYGGLPDLVRSELGYFHPAGRVIQFIVGLMLGNLVIQAERGEGPVSLRDDSAIAGGLELAAMLLWIAAFVFMPTAARELVPMGAPLGFEYLIMYPVHLLISAFTVWVFAHNAGEVSRFLSCRPLFELGRISFEFFLIHWVIIHVLGARLLDAQPDAHLALLVIFMFATSLAFSVMWNWLMGIFRTEPARSAPDALPDILKATEESPSEQVFIRLAQ